MSASSYRFGKSCHSQEAKTQQDRQDKFQFSVHLNRPQDDARKDGTQRVRDDGCASVVDGEDGDPVKIATLAVSSPAGRNWLAQRNDSHGHAEGARETEEHDDIENLDDDLVGRDADEGEADTPFDKDERSEVEQNEHGDALFWLAYVAWDERSRKRVHVWHRQSAGDW